MKQFYVYILSNKKGGVLYTGITNNLLKRIFQHKSKFIDGFTYQYKADRLIYFEVFDDPYNAIVREKQLKKWNRPWKIRLIEQSNKDWEDLYYKLNE